MILSTFKRATAGLALAVALTGGTPAVMAQAWCPPTCGDSLCGEMDGCGEASGCDESGGCGTLDVHKIFDTLAGDESIFSQFKNQKIGGMTYSVGGELRHRFMNEANRLRPPGGNAEYSLWRFTPYMKVQFND